MRMLQTDGPTRAMSGRRSRRLAAILDLLAQRGSVSLTQLADQFHVSPATVRRDLADLGDQRLLVRTHGGARVLDSRAELPVALRDSRFAEAKRAIAEHVAAIVPRHRYAIAVSGGSTTVSVARALAGHEQLTMVTNSISIAHLVTTHPGMKIVMTGGVLRRESLEMVGAIAERTFTSLNVQLAVLGTDGISAAGGVTTHDETEARTNATMLANARRTVVVADGSKVGRLTFAEVAPIQRISLLVTDASADPAEVAAIRAAGVEVVVVAVAAGPPRG